MKSSDEEIMASILKKTKSIMWWARLSYIDNNDFWTPEEQRVLRKIF